MNREKPSPSTKCQDTFLIQSALIPSEKENENSTLRSVSEGCERARVRHQILQVLYLPPEGQTTEEKDEGQEKESSFSQQHSVSIPSVSLNPSNAIGFNRPLTVPVKRTLTITNNNAQPAAFKVKTTSPELYRVYPNLGRVEPGKSVNVTVMLRPMEEEPSMSTKCKDKFLIQSTLILPEQETMPLRDIWKLPPVLPVYGVSEVHQQKLRVTRLPSYSF